jgi:hypothetical protein
MSRSQVYAPPNAFGNWEIVAAHVGGPTTYQISVEPIGDANVVGQVKYFDVDNHEQVKDFSGATEVKTGNSVDNVWVRLKGLVTGTSCWVDVN